LKQTYSIVAWFEAFTWAGLLVGMYFKYGGPGLDAGVWLFGRLHGAAFLLYCAVAILAAAHFRWPWWASLLALFAAIPPLVTLPVESLLRRRGLLDAPAAERNP
jgi:integral membrane protein